MCTDHKKTTAPTNPRFSELHEAHMHQVRALKKVIYLLYDNVSLISCNCTYDQVYSGTFHNSHWFCT